jgi:hypothetical protein
MQAWPQWIFAGLYVYAIIFSTWKAGKQSQLSEMISTILVQSLAVFVLYEGGFWEIWGFKP